jgi:hypothetical protein
MSKYRKLPRWAQWAIPIVVVLVIVSAALPSSSKKGSVSAANSTAQQSKGVAGKSGLTQMDTDVKEARAKTKYIARVDASCIRLQKQYGKRETELATRLGALSVETLEGKEEATKTVDVLAFISRTRAEQFQALTPPPADKAEISKIVANRKEEVDNLNQVTEFVAAGNSNAAREALELVKSDNEEYDGMVQGYGFMACG